MAMERRRGQGLGSGNPKGYLDRSAKIGSPNRPEGLLALVSSCRLGWEFCSRPRQGFLVTKHQGVFPAKKKVSDSEPDLRTRKKTWAISEFDLKQTTKRYKRWQKFLFFGIFFLFFPEIKEKIKEKIEKDNKE